MQNVNRVSAEELDGKPALLFQDLISNLSASEHSREGRILILPLFIANSRALVLDVPVAVASSIGFIESCKIEQDLGGGGKTLGKLGGRQVILAPALGGDSNGVEALAALLESEVKNREICSVRLFIRLKCPSSLP
jgi:hypothetical protein